MRQNIGTWLLMLVLTMLTTGCGGAAEEAAGEAEPLVVCVSSTDVASIVRAVGGEDVEVTAFVRPPDDPHVVEASQAMVQTLAQADLLVIVGLGLEQAWLPAMINQANNETVRADGSGHLDLSANLRTIVGPEGQGVPGSFHPEDNPHYLHDPVEGVKAARAIADRLAALRPEQADRFHVNFEQFAEQIMIAMLGEAVAEKHDAEAFEALAIVIEHGHFEEHLAEHGWTAVELGGWLGRLEEYRGTAVVGDHDMWPYFGRRYGMRVLGYLEPEPGVPPTTPHLSGLIERMREADCRVILSVPYFDPRHARFVADRTGAEILAMAHQPGARPDTDSYLQFVEYNARQLHEALRASPESIAP